MRIIILIKEDKNTKSNYLGSAQCLKITEKVSVNKLTLRVKRATFTFRVEKIIKNAKYGQFWRVFGNSQTVLTDRLLLIRQKLVNNAKIRKFK